MNKYIKSLSLGALSVMALSGCDDYLDTMPDNRTTLDTEEKIQKMLTSSYNTQSPIVVAELSSDNTDEIRGPENPYTEPFYDQTYAWIDETETDNESLENFWQGAYEGIASANEVLEAIGAPGKSATLDECYGEALISRAYNHFMLACMFCQPWTKDAEKALGLPYMESSEKELNPKYERGDLATLYKKIGDDIEEGLKYLGDTHYTVPKYHFNVKAAYAFAARYYLYTEQWDLAIQYATKCLGSQPEAVLRDWRGIASMTQSQKAVVNEYINPSSNANLMLMTTRSRLGVIFSSSGLLSGGCNRYNHSRYCATHEDIQAINIYGAATNMWVTAKYYPDPNRDRVIFWKYDTMFETSQIVAGQSYGYWRAVFPAFTTDEALLNRAEAYIMRNRYDEAAADLTTWMRNFTKSTTTLTPESIKNFYNDIEYSYTDDNGIESTIKKHLNPSFPIDAEGSIQENMLQCMLGFRRIETMHTGMRWFDVRRYGIEIVRRVIDESGQPSRRTDFLSKTDPRRVHQIPLKVRDAGLQENPR